MLTLLTLSLAATPLDDAALAAKFHTLLMQEFAQRPSYATSLGHHEFDDRLDDLSAAARGRYLQRLKDRIAAVKVFQDQPAALSAVGRLDLGIWTAALQRELWEFENEKSDETDPRSYLAYCSDSVYALFTQSTLPRERNVANAAKRIGNVPQVVAAAKANLKNPPKVLTEVAILRTGGAIAFFEKDIYKLANETPTTSELREPCNAAAAALKEYLTFLKNDLLPRSTGEWRLGRAKFAVKLEHELQAGISADEVLKLANLEAIRVENEMAAIATANWSVWFPLEKPPANDRRKLIRMVLEKIAETRSTPQTLVADARKSVEGVKAFIRAKRILTLPEPDRCAVIEMPEFQRGYSAAYLNNAPPLDAQAQSFYAVSPPPSEWTKERQETFFREYNSAMLKVLTIHEAYPGHYVQLEYANRHPSLIRKVHASGAFIEGWAVYTEAMMLDAGYGGSDPALRLQQLKFYLRAVLNAILDHRMHCTDLADADAVRMLMEQGFQTEAEAVAKVQRAKQQSGQLSTYFVGRTAFHRLRQGVEKARGAKFDLGAYHEAVLSHGSVPVKALPELVKP